MYTDKILLRDKVESMASSFTLEEARRAWIETQMELFDADSSVREGWLENLKLEETELELDKQFLKVCKQMLKVMDSETKTKTLLERALYYTNASLEDMRWKSSNEDIQGFNMDTNCTPCFESKEELAEYLSEMEAFVNQLRERINAEG